MNNPIIGKDVAGTPIEVSEVLCVHCGYRWIKSREIHILLKDIDCPYCKNVGYVIETGQRLGEEYIGPCRDSWEG
jgi:hypothetical protein